MGRYKGIVLTEEQRKENRKAHWRRMAQRQREKRKAEPERLALYREKARVRDRARRANNPLLFQEFIERIEVRIWCDLPVRPDLLRLYCKLKNMGGTPLRTFELDPLEVLIRKEEGI